MKDISLLEVSPLIEQVEKTNNSKCLTLATAHIELGILPKLYEYLENIGQCETLDLILYVRGGDINATRKIALLIREYCKKLNVIAPYFCQSSGTILSLAADTIHCGPLSIFSAIDPHLEGGLEGANQFSLSSADIKSFSQMSEKWFDITSTDKNSMLAMLCENIFPPTLTSFYRTVLETEEIAAQLLSYNQKCTEERAKASVKQLMFDFHSHDYCVTGEQLQQMGIKCELSSSLAKQSWPLMKLFSQVIGAGSRDNIEDAWCDLIIADKTSVSMRYKDMSGLAPVWKDQTSKIANG